MYSIGTRKQNSIMCCRMLCSRAYYMAGASDCKHKRLKKCDISIITSILPFVRELTVKPPGFFVE